MNKTYTLIDGTALSMESENAYFKSVFRGISFETVERAMKMDGLPYKEGQFLNITTRINMTTDEATVALWHATGDVQYDVPVEVAATVMRDAAFFAARLARWAAITG